MHHLHLHQATDILIELRHQEIHVKEIIELPALADHRLPKDIAQSHCVHIVTLLGGKVLNVGKLDGRGDQAR